MRVYLAVPFEEKEDAKACGARWDAAKRKWYVVDPQDLGFFASWIQDDAKQFLKTKKIHKKKQKNHMDKHMAQLIQEVEQEKLRRESRLREQLPWRQWDRDENNTNGWVPPWEEQNISPDERDIFLEVLDQNVSHASGQSRSSGDMAEQMKKAGVQPAPREDEKSTRISMAGGTARTHDSKTG